MPKVNFIGIGAQKCGTSWLDACLREHPEIYMFPEKEAHFFDSVNNLSTSDIYEACFHETDEKIVGEITPSYIFYRKCHELIYQYNPNVKLIAILRDPTERAISQYKMEMARGSIEPNEGIWDSFERGLPLYGPIRERGLYQQQLDLYYSLFDRDQILVLDYDDIAKSPEKLIKTVFEFLDVDSSFIPSKLNKRIQPLEIENLDISKVNVDPEDVNKIRNYYDDRKVRN